MNDVLVPHFKDLFHLTNVRALLVQFAFFGAYFLLSVPSGWLVSRIGYQAGIVLSLCTVGLGLLLFVPASILITYPLFLLGLFIVGCGLALLQVAVNPYVGALGSRRNHAKRTQRLKEAGFSDEEIKRIHSPIGINVGAQSPQEIAISIMAELILALRGPKVYKPADAPRT